MNKCNLAYRIVSWVDKIANMKIMNVVYNFKDNGMLDMGIIRCTFNTSVGEITSTSL